MEAFLEALMLLVSGPESHRRSLPLQCPKPNLLSISGYQKVNTNKLMYEVR